MSNKVNIDYICVIREENRRTSFERIEIPSQRELEDKLDGMVNDSRKTLLYMQSEMDHAFSEKERNSVNFISPFNYSDAYIQYASYPNPLSDNEYNNKLNERKASLTNHFAESHQRLLVSNPSAYDSYLLGNVEYCMVEYQKELKKEYLGRAKRFIMAKKYVRTLAEIRRDPQVKMYSTDTLGWSTFHYQVTEDIDINIGTNFGYGSASYFLLSLRYKGIDILPYSYIVKYYYANMRDIRRCTGIYKVAHESWNSAFDYVKDAANHAANNEAEFVQKYILSEVEQMISGLSKIMNDPRAYMDTLYNDSDGENASNYLTVRNMDDLDKKRYKAYPEEMTMAVKADKITGALELLENLEKLSLELHQINYAITDIKRMSQAIVPEINDMINHLTEEINALNQKKMGIENLLKLLKGKAAPYEKMVDELYEKEDKNGVAYRLSIVEELSKNHPKYAQILAEIKKLLNKRTEINDILLMRGTFRDKLSECKHRVEDAGLIKKENNSLLSGEIISDGFLTV